MTSVHDSCTPSSLLQRAWTLCKYDRYPPIVGVGSLQAVKICWPDMPGAEVELGTTKQSKLDPIDLVHR